MFLFEKLVVLNLYEQTSRKLFMEEMQKKFPQNLQETYGQIMDRIMDSGTTTARRIDAKRLLGWIACAKRPMKWYNICPLVKIPCCFRSRSDSLSPKDKDSRFRRSGGFVVEAC
ncbi:hypothetical protein BDZ45DRAFT_670476 [Acephala macrosclerotiorum]|nr:hypothetical protein BDZ45DRAFT_670476 [Acephala macrosclerotiorum]